MLLPQATLPLRTAAITLRIAPLSAPTGYTHAPYRNSSSTTDRSTATRTTTTASTTTTPSSIDGTKLTWDAFLRLRRSRRRYNLVSSIFTSFLGTSAGVGYLANKEIDPTQMIMGIDPLVMFGLAMVGCGAGGWLFGPVLGSGVFGIVKRRQMPQIAEREREFLLHIKKNRVDPSFQSFSNPVPDYYGEKIGSVKQYRQWLKDQRAYNRKSKNFL